MPLMAIIYCVVVRSIESCRLPPQPMGVAVVAGLSIVLKKRGGEAMPVYLHGLRIKHFRAIGAEIVELTPFKTFNFFIGANNAGKSTVLDFIHKHVPRKRNNGQLLEVPDLDQHVGSRRGQLDGQIALLAADARLVFEKAWPSEGVGHEFSKTTSKFVDLLKEGDYIWIREIASPHPTKMGWEFVQNIVSNVPISLVDNNSLNALTHKIRNTGYGDRESAVNSILEAFKKLLKPQFPKVSLIPAIRQIYASEGADGKELEDFSGRKLIDWLFRIQVPEWNRLEEREPIDKINILLQSLTGTEKAEIAIPANRQHINVTMDGKTLPLSQLGTGIHHLIMIAAFSTMCKRQILCIEEPELYLHPILQRKLINYLKDNTDNQYFISSHSAAFIDTPDAAIFHVTHDGDHANIRQAELSQHKYEICADLGYRASDIMQANAVIWVEGPSDRIYLRHWIETVAPELIEGIHYSIMFYGGRLLRHLSADDQEIKDFIALRPLNRNLALLMDSDKEFSRAHINDTKKRLRDEFQKDSGVCWITKGREIENYIDKEQLDGALKDLYTSYDGPASRGDYEHNFYFMRYPPRAKGKAKRETYKGADKVSVARKICESKANLDVLDLRVRIQEVVDMIKKSNNL
jgi:predicted ATPase